MKIAVMQPYFMPYIGYFQMIKAVDKFVFYDDVNYIKQGWINRNKLIVNNQEYLFTIPLEKATPFALINETKINKNLYPGWKKKFLKTITQSYRKAPLFEEVYPLIETILASEDTMISQVAMNSIIEVSTYLGLDTEFITSSSKYDNRELERQERLIDICKIENAEHYINAIGGQKLYDREDFHAHGIQLHFIESEQTPYDQFCISFIPGLSIVDLLMFNSVEQTNHLLQNYILK